MAATMRTCVYWDREPALRSYAKLPDIIFNPLKETNLMIERFLDILAKN